MPAAARAKDGPDLASQLEDLLDDTPFDITTLSRDPEGDQADGLAPELRSAGLVPGGRANGRTATGAHRTAARRSRLGSLGSDSVALIPKAHKAVAETPFEKKLPQVLVTFEILDTPVWRWLALLLTEMALWFVSGFVARRW